MTIKYSKKADLRPLYIKISFILWFQNIQNDRDSVFIVVSNYTLICIGSIRFDDAALLLASLGWLMVLQLNRFGV